MHEATPNPHVAALAFKGNAANQQIVLQSRLPLQHVDPSNRKNNGLNHDPACRHKQPIL